jgi:hypothetical protein
MPTSRPAPAIVTSERGKRERNGVIVTIGSAGGAPALN